MDTTSQLNLGMIPWGDRTPPGDETTIIVTGIARSGTSMVASVLRAAGLPMGEDIHEVVEEDAEMLAILQSGHQGLLRDLIRRRDARWPKWSFKVPNLHAFMVAEQVAWFRRPRLVVIYRDPVAVAVRAALAERFDVVAELASTSHALTSLTGFVTRARFPALLLSYEKAITAPDDMLPALLAFCGLTAPDGDPHVLLRAIQPNNPLYLETAVTHFQGQVEGIINHNLYGWCYQKNSLVPVRLELLIDGEPALEFQADRLREDLQSRRIGNGNHGFYVDIKNLHIADTSRISVRIRGRTVLLDGGDQTVAALTAAHVTKAGD